MLGLLGLKACGGLLACGGLWLFGYGFGVFALWDGGKGMSFDRDVPDLMMFYEFCKQSFQGGLFVGTETGKELLVVAIGDLCKLGKIAPARGRQRQQLAPTITGVHLAPDPALCLELVNDLRDRSTSHCQSFGKLAWRCLFALIEMT